MFARVAGSMGTVESRALNVSPVCAIRLTHKMETATAASRFAAPRLVTVRLLGSRSILRFQAALYTVYRDDASCNGEQALAGGTASPTDRFWTVVAASEQAPADCSVETILQTNFSAAFPCGKTGNNASNLGTNTFDARLSRKRKLGLASRHERRQDCCFVVKAMIDPDNTPYREAGQIVAAIEMGIEDVQASLFVDDDFRAQNEGMDLPRWHTADAETNERIRNLAERRIVIRLAGEAAENLHLGRGAGGAWPDDEAARRLAHKLFRSEKVTGAYLRFCEERACEIVESLWWAVSAVAEALAERKELNAAQCSEVIVAAARERIRQGKLAHTALVH
jgi:hypothetical protein